MAKIQRMDIELYQLLHAAWLDSAGSMPDADRPREVLDILLFNDGGNSQWYELPGHYVWAYVRNVIPQLSADFHLLRLPGGEDDLQAPELRNLLREVMREYDLRRLTMLVPAPAIEAQALAVKVGFEIEGRLKDATVYEGRYTDMVVFGFYRGTVDQLGLSEAAKNAPRRKRRRRSRRRKHGIQSEYRTTS